MLSDSVPTRWGIGFEARVGRFEGDTMRRTKSDGGRITGRPYALEQLDVMRLDAVRRLWERLAEHGPQALDDSASFTDSEREAGRMVLPLLEDLKAARQAIEEASRHTRALEAALDCLPVPAIAVDGNGRYLAGNPAAGRLFGGPAVPQAVLYVAARSAASDEPVEVPIMNRTVRIVPGSAAPRHPGGAPDPDSSRIFFFVPADGSFELDTEHLQARCGLTATQGRVAGLAAQGLTNKEIAARLSVSADTVHKHLMSAFQKTGASTRAGLVALAFGARFGIDL